MFKISVTGGLPSQIGSIAQTFPFFLTWTSCWRNTQIVDEKPWPLRHQGRDEIDVILKYIFQIENIWIPTKISQKFDTKGPINNIPALV